MNGLEDIKFLNLALNELIGPIVIIFFTVAIGKMFLNIAENFAAQLLFRLKGYKTHMTIRINDKLATITRIGILSTHFQVINGNDNRVEYMAVSNNRLDYHDVRRLVRVFKDDHEGRKK